MLVYLIEKSIKPASFDFLFTDVLTELTLYLPLLYSYLIDDALFFSISNEESSSSLAFTSELIFSLDLTTTLDGVFYPWAAGIVDELLFLLLSKRFLGES